MTTKYTPGPWTVELDITNNGDISVFAPELLPVASIDVREYPEDTGGIPRETALANARLISAAPDLLEACSKALAYIEDSNPGAVVADAHVSAIAEGCRAAIQKAEASQ